jgi:glycosyltransferase involved in cell wall biosynthesis
MAHYAIGTGLLARLIPRDADVLNPHEWLPHVAAVRAAAGRPVVWMVNDPNRWDMIRTGRQLARPLPGIVYELVGRFDDRLVRRVDRVLCLDHRMKNIIESSKGVNATVVRSGLDVERFRNIVSRDAARDRLGRRSDEFIVLGVGILFPHRRFEDLVSAAARLRQQNLKLILVGRHDRSPEYGRYLERLVDELGVRDMVTFIKQSLGERDLLDFYAAADAFCFPNEEQTWGLAAAEAMAAGLPVVVTPGAGIHEVIKDGSTGIVVPTRSPHAIAQALESLQRDSSRREAIGAAARRFALDELSWDKYAAQMLRQFEIAMSQRTR